MQSLPTKSGRDFLLDTVDSGAPNLRFEEDRPISGRASARRKASRLRDAATTLNSSPVLLKLAGGLTPLIVVGRHPAFFVVRGAWSSGGCRAFSRPELLMISEDEARSLGVRVGVTRNTLLLAASLISVFQQEQYILLLGRV